MLYGINQCKQQDLGLEIVTKSELANGTLLDSTRIDGKGRVNTHVSTYSFIIDTHSCLKFFSSQPQQFWLVNTPQH